MSESPNDGIKPTKFGLRLRTAGRKFLETRNDRSVFNDSCGNPMFYPRHILLCHVQLFT